MSGKPKLTVQMVRDIEAEMRKVRQPEVFIVLSRDVYDTLSKAYATNGETMPLWIIRQVDIGRKKREEKK